MVNADCSGSGGKMDIPGLVAFLSEGDRSGWFFRRPLDKTIGRSLDGFLADEISIRRCEVVAFQRFSVELRTLLNPIEKG